MNKLILISSLAVISFLSACSEIEPKPFPHSSGHIKDEPQPAGDIPELVTQVPELSAPAPAAELEKYTVVVNEVPVKELLFALARDAQLNVDIHPEINGVVTMNAVDQPLSRILERLSKQVDMRYQFDGNVLEITVDSPYFKEYSIDYVNIGRDTINTNTIATNLANSGVDVGEGGGGGALSGNNSTTDVISESQHRFWSSITNNIIGIVGGEVSSSVDSLNITDSVLPNPETGIILVKATERQHEEIQRFLDITMKNVRRQVLIQVSIVEVALSDEYSAGIDWTNISFGNFAFSVLTGGVGGVAAISAAPGLVGNFDTNSVSATIQLMEEFGEVTVLSSPQLMALNNQTAILKRVDNKVFFTIESETIVPAVGASSQSFDTEIHTLPVGIVMTILPHITESGEIILLVRPTISRTTGVDKLIPLPPGVAPVPGNEIPETVSQEMESILRLTSGQTAVLGGLMEDRTTNTVDAVPGFSKIPIVGDFFTSTSTLYTKVETVIFIKPLVIEDPNINTDLQQYRHFLDASADNAHNPNIPNPTFSGAK